MQQINQNQSNINPITKPFPLASEQVREKQMQTTKEKPRYEKIDIRQDVTNKIIQMIEAGGLHFANDFVKSIPKNASTNAFYSGVNVLLLSYARMMSGFDSNYWLTYKQAQSMSGQVRKGELGVRCAKLIKVESKTPQIKGDKHEDKISVMSHFTLFNVCQIDGLPTTYKNTDFSQNEFSAIEEIEKIVLGSSAKIEHGGDVPCYIPSLDIIKMPCRESFTSTAGYYNTLMHELTHWTGHKDRLNRDFSGRFKTASYAFEELVAELGSAFLNAQTGLIGETIQSNAAYIENWLTVLRNDKTAIFTAASKASEACDYIFEHLILKRLIRAHIKKGRKPFFT